VLPSAAAAGAAAAAAAAAAVPFIRSGGLWMSGYLLVMQSKQKEGPKRAVDALHSSVWPALDTLWAEVI
jgi:hypothetical protein